MRLNTAVLDDPSITLLDGVEPIARRTAATAQLWHDLDDIEHALRARKA